MTILEYIHEIFETVPAIDNLVSLLNPSQRSHLDLSPMQKHSPLLSFKDSGNSESEDEDRINDEELENI